MFIFVVEIKKISLKTHVFLIFGLLANHKIAAIDECKGSQIYPEGSGVF